MLFKIRNQVEETKKDRQRKEERLKEVTSAIKSDPAKGLNNVGPTTYATFETFDDFVKSKSHNIETYMEDLKKKGPGIENPKKPIRRIRDPESINRLYGKTAAAKDKKKSAHGKRKNIRKKVQDPVKSDVEEKEQISEGKDSEPEVEGNDEPSGEYQNDED